MIHTTENAARASEAQLEDQLVALFREMYLEVPSMHTDLIEEGILDSMAFMSLLFRLRSRYGIEIAIESVEADDFRTIAAIAHLMRDYIDP